MFKYDGAVRSTGKNEKVDSLHVPAMKFRAYREEAVRLTLNVPIIL